MRNIIVTGGSRGIGLGIVRKLATSGFQVIAISRTRGTGLDTVIKDAAEEGVGRVSYFQQDLGDIEALSDAARELRRQFGPIYGVVNNAGIGMSGLLCNMHATDIERLTRLNIISPLVFTKHLLRSMLAARAGRIVNISSIVAVTGYQGISAYSATKSAMLGFTRSLAREVGSVGITVNAILPGFVETEMTLDMDDASKRKIAHRSALGRLTTIDDVANTVDYLVSDQAHGITGSLMVVDAGATA
ncbi:SDR family NAD(P)-dependent oxidoreductase [Acidocella sp. KAb 2-4]|uniref:SDR family NAD(P)-dependent oxidoreductase n=1 Tax=Acidocella sp. KAb 2-4 TaxID=2885158 RepID=UPI001D0882D2|nr:SDR family NAD(P)-dependent oxidoreductase [Acidocella sp. KAb 2-4]MCB5946047.1 SDR family oxidoreductase [Acidocella sp. KAb 2-4]